MYLFLNFFSPVNSAKNSRKRKTKIDFQRFFFTSQFQRRSTVENEERKNGSTSRRLIYLRFEALPFELQ